MRNILKSLSTLFLLACFNPNTSGIVWTCDVGSTRDDNCPPSFSCMEGYCRPPGYTLNSDGSTYVPIDLRQVTDSGYMSLGQVTTPYCKAGLAFDVGKTPGNTFACPGDWINSTDNSVNINSLCANGAKVAVDATTLDLDRCRRTGTNRIYMSKVVISRNDGGITFCGVNANYPHLMFGACGSDQTSDILPLYSACSGFIQGRDCTNDNQLDCTTTNPVAEATTSKYIFDGAICVVP